MAQFTRLPAYQPWDAAAFATFDAYQYVMSAVVGDSRRRVRVAAGPATAAMPTANAPPSVDTFRDAGKSESAVQTEYKRATNSYHHGLRDEQV